MLHSCCSSGHRPLFCEFNRLSSNISDVYQNLDTTKEKATEIFNEVITIKRELQNNQRILKAILIQGENQEQQLFREFMTALTEKNYAKAKKMLTSSENKIQNLNNILPDDNNELSPLGIILENIEEAISSYSEEIKLIDPAFIDDSIELIDLMLKEGLDVNYPVNRKMPPLAMYAIFFIWSCPTDPSVLKFIDYLKTLNANQQEKYFYENKPSIESRFGYLDYTLLTRVSQICRLTQSIQPLLILKEFGFKITGGIFRSELEELFNFTSDPKNLISEALNLILDLFDPPIDSGSLYIIIETMIQNVPVRQFVKLLEIIQKHEKRVDPPFLFYQRARIVSEFELRIWKLIDLLEKNGDKMGDCISSFDELDDIAVRITQYLIELDVLPKNFKAHKLGEDSEYRELFEYGNKDVIQEKLPKLYELIKPSS